MDAEQLEKIRIIQSRDHRPKVMAAQFAAGGDRTLVYGTHINDTGGKDTFHVYVKDGKLHRFIYRLHSREVVEYESASSMHGTALVPNKRIYWEHSDFDAVWFLAVLDIPMWFTTSGSSADRGQWAGPIHEEFTSGG